MDTNEGATPPVKKRSSALQKVASSKKKSDDEYVKKGSKVQQSSLQSCTSSRKESTADDKVNKSHLFQPKSSFNISSKHKVNADDCKGNKDLSVKLQNLTLEGSATKSKGNEKFFVKQQKTFQCGSTSMSKEYTCDEKVKDLLVPQKKHSFQSGSTYISKETTGDKKVNKNHSVQEQKLFQGGGSSNIKVNDCDDKVNEDLFVNKTGKEMFDEAPDASAHCENVEIIRAIVYGSKVWSLGRKLKNGHTHEWRVYLKSYRNEDMSRFVKLVEFKLNKSYAHKIRVCHAPPYEVTETGSEEFKMKIQIYFKDENEKVVTIYHLVKFLDENNPTDKHTVWSESYEELIFRNPTAKMRDLLKHRKFFPGELRHKIDYEKKKTCDLQKVLAAKAESEGENFAMTQSPKAWQKAI